MSYALGSQVPLSLSVVGADGVTPVTPATCTISIVQPDGTPVTLTLAGGDISSPATGQCIAFWTPTQIGWHQWSGASTGPVTARPPDSFTVVGATASATAAPLVSLAEVREHLRIASTAEDASLLRVALVATEICEGSSGTNRIWRRHTFTETFSGGGHYWRHDPRWRQRRDPLRLGKFPPISVSSVVESGITLTPGTDYTLETATGLLFRGLSPWFGPWGWGEQNIVVTYAAGSTGAIPEVVRQGVLELTKHLWDTRRGGSNLPRQSGSDDSWDPRMGYTIPRRVEELWAPHTVPSL